MYSPAFNLRKDHLAGHVVAVWLDSWKLQVGCGKTVCSGFSKVGWVTDGGGGRGSGSGGGGGGAWRMWARLLLLQLDMLETRHW